MRRGSKYNTCFLAVLLLICLLNAMTLSILTTHRVQVVPALAQGSASAADSLAFANPSDGQSPAATLPADTDSTQQEGSSEQDYIRYVEFNPTYDALKKAMDLDIQSQNEEVVIDWIDLLAYLGATYGGDFSRYQESDMDAFVQQLQSGRSVQELTDDMQYFAYYREAYGAVLQEFLGTYRVQQPSEENPDQLEWVECYGLKNYSPIAKGFAFEHYDDFGQRRTYGYSRAHLGHDMMAATGTPVIAVESGVVEAMGWNQYGGWRIGIRSFDGQRYYYYAHLRQNRPYHCDLYEGKVVKAGDVIGYVGRTGYSTTENVNNIEVSHLHFGLQLIFDESQKESDNEIWVDCYALVQLLQHHKSSVIRIAETKEFYREFDSTEPLLTG